MKLYHRPISTTRRAVMPCAPVDFRAWRNIGRWLARMKALPRAFEPR